MTDQEKKAAAPGGPKKPEDAKKNEKDAALPQEELVSIAINNHLFYCKDLTFCFNVIVNRTKKISY